MTQPSESESSAKLGHLDRGEAWRIELSRELAFRATLEGTFLETNSSFADMLGWSRAELLTKNFMDLVHPDDVLETTQEWRRVVDAETPAQFSVRHRCKDGSSRWVAWSGVARAATFCAVGHDATLEVESSKARDNVETAVRAYQRSDSIVRLGAGLRHEFNNLFQTIVSALQLLQRLIRAGRIAETEQFIESAMRAGRDAAEINQRLAALSRPLEPSPTTLPMNELIAGVVDLLRRSLPRSYELVTGLAADLWPIRCDQQQAQLAMVSMLFNACDAIPDGGTLFVSTRNENPSGTDVTGDSSRFIAIQVTALPSTEGETRSPPDRCHESAALKSTLESKLLMVQHFAHENGGRIGVDVDDRRQVILVLYLPGAALSDQESSAQSTPSMTA